MNKKQSTLLNIAQKSRDDVQSMKKAIKDLGKEVPMITVLEVACMNNNINIAMYLFEVYKTEILKGCKNQFEVVEICAQEGFNNTLEWYRCTVCGLRPILID